MNEMALQSVAYVHAQVACALIELEAMKAANRERDICGDAPAYGEAAFMALQDKYGIHHNAVLTTLGR